MAESKGSVFAKSVQKHAGRAKEKLLQNLGKVDRTADEIFDEHLNNYSRQQNNANKLQKEFNNYIRCIRAVQVASKSLMDAICEVYESQWTGSEALHAQISAVEVLYQDYSHKLGDQVLIPLNTYTAQFPEMRKKIEKRNRKLIDYDSQRHSFQNVQASAAKRKDDIKITKGREQLEEARRTYELLNSELHDELPALHDSRILFLVTNLQTLFASEQVFHSETSKIYAELEAIVDKLATDSQRGSYTFKKIAATTNSNPSSPPQSPVKQQNSITNNTYPNAVTNGNGVATPESPSTSNSPSPIDHKFDTDNDVAVNNKRNSGLMMNNGGAENNRNSLNTQDQKVPPLHHHQLKHEEEDTKPEATYQNSEIINSEKNTKLENNNEDTTTNNTTILNNSTTTTTTTTTTQIKKGGTESPDLNKTNENNQIELETTTTTIEIVNGNSQPPAPVTPTGVMTSSPTVPSATENNYQQLYDIPVGATTTDLPAGVLYRVKATYRYFREDADELSFEVGDTIRVIEYDDPDDQEEGWLMGIKEGSTEKGLFPANFTRPL